MQTQNIHISLSDNLRRKSFSISLSVSVNNKLISKRYLVFDSENNSISDNQSSSFLISVPSLLHIHLFSRWFLDHFSMVSRSFLDHRSMYRTCSVLVGSMYRPSGYTQKLNYIFSNIPYGFLKPIPQYFPRPPNGKII